jgi:O-antigen/teichoic acid export membrane protein
VKEVQANAISESKPLSTRRNFSWMLAGNVIFGVCQWAMLSVLAKLANPEIVGKFTLALAITAPVIMFASLNLRSVLVTDTREDYSFNEYFALRLAAMGLSFAVTTTLALMVGGDWETRLIIILIMAAKVFDSVSDILYAYQQRHEQMNCIAISRIIQGSLQLLTLGAVFYKTKNLVFACAVMALASGLITLIYDIPCTARVAASISQGRKRFSSGAFRTIAPVWHLAPIQSLARLSLPLGIVAVLGIIIFNTPRYFLAHYMSEREVGLFSAMWSFLFPLLMVFGSVAQAIAPRMARYYQEDLRQFKQLLRKMLVMATICGVLGVLFALFAGRQALTLLFRSEYAEHPMVFLWIMVSAGLYYVTVPLTQAVNSARSFNVQPLIYSSAVIAGVVGCMVWIAPYGLLGASWALCASMLSLLIGLAIALAIHLQREQTSKAVSHQSVG